MSHFPRQPKVMLVVVALPVQGVLHAHLLESLLGLHQGAYGILFVIEEEVLGRRLGHGLTLRG